MDKIVGMRWLMGNLPFLWVVCDVAVSDDELILIMMHYKLLESHRSSGEVDNMNDG